jgi:NADPH:quinone reductase-like Zn-dependent oxidoreductase
VKALVYKSFGDPGVLEWVEDWTKPTVTANQVLIRVTAGSVNPKDVLLRKGKFSRTLARDPLPRVSGLDVAGEVVEMGKDVVGLTTGDLVFGMTNNFSGGVHSEYAVFDVFGKYSKKDFVRQLGKNGIFVSTVPKAATLGGELLARVGLSQRSRLVRVRSCTKDLNQLRDWIESNKLTPHVEKIYPITAAQDAHRHIESKHTTGKVVLRCSIQPH